jgi:hypothetical protein
VLVQAAGQQQTHLQQLHLDLHLPVIVCHLQCCYQCRLQAAAATCFCSASCGAAFEVSLHLSHLSCWQIHSARHLCHAVAAAAADLVPVSYAPELLEQ